MKKTGRSSTSIKDVRPFARTFACLSLNHIRIVNTSLKTTALILSLATAATKADIDAKAVYIRVRPSVVLITTYHESGEPLALGTGFAIADGTRIATNSHILAGASKVRIKTSDGTQAEIKSLIAIDTVRDLAVLISPVKLSPIPLAATKPAVGDSILAVGNPIGLEASISVGLISGIREIKHVALYQISAPISPGSSGGPVLNSAGEAIGITAFTLKHAQNINFCVPAPLLQPLLASKTKSPITQLRTLKTSDIASITQKPHEESPIQTAPGEGLHENMTMLEVERLLGKPDDIHIQQGYTSAEYEYPTVTTWYYKPYKITASDLRYGEPGHLLFVPERFTHFCKDPDAADRMARNYGGEQPNSFRTVSYEGSFPTSWESWPGVPVKPLNRKKTNR